MLTQQALEQYHAHDLHWSADLVVALEGVRLGLALEWVSECVKSLVVHAALPESKEKLLNWLAGLAPTESTADGSNLLEESDLVWHEKRDFIHTAIAHLYAARAYLLQNNSVRYRTLVIWAANVMGITIITAKLRWRSLSLCSSSS